MRAPEILDVLGNETRRKILRLLADRPCYVSELCERLDVAPKAVISHLELMERAGLISSFEERQRKYFQISENLHLMVSVSPFSFGAMVERIGEERANPERVAELLKEAEECMQRCTTLRGVTDALSVVRRLQQELHSIHRYVQRLETEIVARCAELVDEIVDDPLEAEMLFHLIKSGSIDHAREILELSDEEFDLRLENLRRGRIVKVRGKRIYVEER